MGMGVRSNGLIAWGAVALLLASGALCGCATGTRTSSAADLQSARPTPGEEEILRRLQQLEASIQRVEDEIRRLNAQSGAQLDGLRAQLASLNAKVAAQDRLLSRAASAVSGSGRPALEADTDDLDVLAPQPGETITRLDGPDPYATDRSARVRYGPATGPPPSAEADSVQAEGPQGTGAATAPGAEGLPPAEPRSGTIAAADSADAGAPSAAPDAGAGEPLDVSEMRQAGDLGTLIPDPPEEGRRRYETAYRDLQRENYQLALINFRAFLDEYPATRLSDNAQYWIGEVYYAQGQFTQAAEEFRKVVDDYAGQDKVPAAYYKIALCFINLRDKVTAKRYLDYLVERFPDTREAQLAEQKRAEL